MIEHVSNDLRALQKCFRAFVSTIQICFSNYIYLLSLQVSVVTMFNLDNLCVAVNYFYNLISLL